MAAMPPPTRRRPLDLSPLVRRSAVVVTTAIIAAGAVIMTGIYAWDWSLGLGRADRVSVIGTALGLLGAVYAGAAVVFALAAYLAATARPKIRVDLHFNQSDPNRPVFGADGRNDAPEGWLFASPTQQAGFSITITNDSKVAAHNPGLRVEFEGIRHVQPANGWAVLHGVSTDGARILQWDGGTDNIIHGRWERRPPFLSINSPAFPIQIRQHGAAVVLTLVADGVEPITREIPVQVLSAPEYAAYIEGRNSSDK